MKLDKYLGENTSQNIFDLESKIKKYEQALYSLQNFGDPSRKRKEISQYKQAIPKLKKERDRLIKTLPKNNTQTNEIEIKEVKESALENYMFYDRTINKIYKALQSNKKVFMYKEETTKYGSVWWVKIDGNDLQLSKKKMKDDAFKYYFK